MARTSNRRNTGPGRSERSGASVRPEQTGSVRTATNRRPPTQNEEVVIAKKRPDFARRMAAFGVLMLVLAISYIGTARTFWGQQHELAIAEERIREDNQKITQLEEQLARWNDPEYVKAQARSRLGWLLPGEIGYAVVDENGEIVSTTGRADATKDGIGDERQSNWWNLLTESIQLADAPTRKVTMR